MMTGWLSILQYAPDETRGELLNIGAVVFFPEQRILKFDIHVTKTRIEKFDPRFHYEYLNAFEKNLRRRLFEPETESIHSRILEDTQFLLSDLPRRFAGARLSMSPFEEVFLDTEDFQETHADVFLQNVINRYVKTPTKTKTKPSKQPRLQSVLRKEFEKRGWLGKSIDHHEIVPGFPLTGTGFRCDYAFKNGIYHVIDTCDLTLQSEKILQSETCIIKVKHDKAHDLFKGSRAYTAIRASQKNSEAHKDLIELLQENSDVFNLEQEDQNFQFYQHFKQLIQSSDSGLLSL